MKILGHTLSCLKLKIGSIRISRIELLDLHHKTHNVFGDVVDISPHTVATE